MLTLTLVSCGFLTDVVGSKGLKGRLVLCVVSARLGLVEVVWAAAHVRAVGTVVSGATVVFVVKPPSSSSSGRCCSAAPMLCTAASVIPGGGWECVAFCCGAFVLLVGLSVKRAPVMELLVGEWELKTSVTLLVCAELLCGESDVPVGSDSPRNVVTLIRSSCEVMAPSDSPESSPEPWS